MLFSSLSFLYLFLPTLIILYFLSRSLKWRNTILLAASLVFYSWGDPNSTILLLLSSLAAYLFALAIERFPTRKSLFLWGAVVLFVGVLIYFKYLNFIFESISAISNQEFTIKQVFLPAGISFYTFQLLSYLFDVYRGNTSAEKNLPRFLLYVSFFPQLLQGPIIRYENIRNQFIGRSSSWDGAISGVRRFIVGLGKKVLIADNIALIASSIYSSPDFSGTAALWLAAICYTLQLYFDFSGYCDMAIGLGRIFGFRIPENFKYPYAATSITDFWRRWHISLSLWFRDYIYIPLGGNRVNKSRFMLNILIVWSLTGLWHGASWNFVLWGLYYGILLLIEKLVLGARIEKIPMLFRRISSLFFIIIGWVLFNLSDTQTLLSVLKEMFIFSPTDWVSLLIQDTSICSKLLFLPIAVVFAFPVAKKVNLPDNSIWRCIINNVAHMAVLAFSIMYIISSNFTPFIYFSF